MKREDMVKSIQNFIKYWEGHPDKKAVANALLETIEQKGMLPPGRLENFPVDGGARIVYTWDEETISEG